MRTLGRTCLRVSIAGLGCGGHSRLGLSQGRSQEEAERIVRQALDLGINFIDTAESYGTEEVVGRGIAGHSREALVISTKAGIHQDGKRYSPEELRLRLEGCLTRLQTDYVDLFHLHGVSLEDYAYAEDVLAPAMIRWKEQGKIRAVGITEAFIHDTEHQMLHKAVGTPWWDVVMVGFNLLNPSARHRVLPSCQARGIGTLCMFAVRRALSQPQASIELISGLVEKGLIDGSQIDPEDPLGFLTMDDIAGSVQEAAYRFCAWEPGIDVVLTTPYFFAAASARPATGSQTEAKKALSWTSAQAKCSSAARIPILPAPTTPRPSAISIAPSDSSHSPLPASDQGYQLWLNDTRKFRSGVVTR